MASMISAQNANAENWVAYSEIESNGTTFYIETETIRKGDGFVYYWTMMDFLESPYKSGNLSVKTYEKGDCESDRFQRLAYVFYKENMGRGTTDYQDSNNKGWRYIIPSSVGAIALDFACSYVD